MKFMKIELVKNRSTSLSIFLEVNETSWKCSMRERLLGQRRAGEWNNDLFCKLKRQLFETDSCRRSEVTQVRCAGRWRSSEKMAELRLFKHVG